MLHVALIMIDVSGLEKPWIPLEYPFREYYVKSYNHITYKSLHYIREVCGILGVKFYIFNRKQSVLCLDDVRQIIILDNRRKRSVEINPTT